MVTWRKFNHPAIAAGSGWESSLVKDPCLVKVGSDLHLYYSGYNGTNFQIGRATSTDGGLTWTKYGSNPVLTRGGGGAWDEHHVSFPIVMYDAAEADSSRRWKMWYSGAAAATPGKESIGFAYSSDGLSWTKYGQVLAPGTSGAIDDESCTNCAVYRTSSSDWTIFYGARPTTSNPAGDTIARATFSTPESTYTKQGTVISPSTASQALTANLAAGGTSVTVASSAGFTVGEPVVLRDSTSATEEHKVAAIPDGTHVTLAAQAGRAWTTANTASIRSAFYGSLNPRSILLVGSTYVQYGTAFQQFGGSPFYERSVAWTASSLSGTWTPDLARGLYIPLDTVDALAAENPSVVAL